MLEPFDHQSNRRRRSPMGAGAIALAILAWGLLVLAFAWRVPHELAGVALMIALSGAAVAREGRRVEESVSPTLQTLGLLLNVCALGAAVLSIVIEIIRRKLG